MLDAEAKTSHNYKQTMCQKVHMGLHDHVQLHIHLPAHSLLASLAFSCLLPDV